MSPHRPCLEHKGLSISVTQQNRLHAASVGAACGGRRRSVRKQNKEFRHRCSEVIVTLIIMSAKRWRGECGTLSERAALGHGYGFKAMDVSAAHQLQGELPQSSSAGAFVTVIRGSQGSPAKQNAYKQGTPKQTALTKWWSYLKSDRSCMPTKNAGFIKTQHFVCGYLSLCLCVCVQGVFGLQSRKVNDTFITNASGRSQVWCTSCVSSAWGGRVSLDLMHW